MKCFYHQTVDAVGHCKYCARGLCADCAAEAEGGLACKGRHETQVESISRLVSRNVNYTRNVNSIVLVMAAVYWLAAFACVYLLAQEAMWKMKLLFAVMAAILLVPAIMRTRYLVISSRYK